MTFGLPKSLFEQFHVDVKCKRVPKISLLTSYLSNMNWNLVSSKKYLIGRTNLISDIFIVLNLKHFIYYKNVCILFLSATPNPKSYKAKRILGDKSIIFWM